VEQDRVEVAAAAGEVRRLAQAASLEDERLAEALVHRAHGVVVAQVPLAEDAGPVAPLAEHLRKGYLVGVHHRAAEERVDDAGTIVVPAGHEAGPGGGADGGDVELGEANPFPGQAVEVGRLQDGVAVAGEIPVALVVGDDDDYIRPSRLRLRLRFLPPRRNSRGHHEKQCGNVPPALG
jgi:hypothetical protein